MATLSSILAWKTPQTEEPGEATHSSWVAKSRIWLHMHTYIKPHASPPSFSSVQLLSRVRLFATPWIAARQASLSVTNSRSSLRLTSIKSVMPSSHLILCRPLLLLPPIPPSIRVFSNESTFRMRWPKYWSFSCSIIPSKEIPSLIRSKIKNNPVYSYLMRLSSL